MQFYTVTDNYIAYLKNIDANVPDNYSGKRPYVGVVLEVGEHKYLAPLTSYKPKQDKLHPSNQTIFKIYEKGNELNKLGMIHLNNMIPVIQSEIATIDFSQQPKHYENLLTKQFSFVKSNQDAIKKRASTLHQLVTIDKHQFFCSISCDFLKLEGSYKNFP